MRKQPLVSVAVITYNSAKTVLETLDSIYNQSYQNIELIISDDCSSDDTVSICEKWIAEKQNRFCNTKIIISDTNTGISANFNRAIRNCSGDWLKTIAGDDSLLPDCIESYLDYVAHHTDAICVFSKVCLFDQKGQHSSYADPFDYGFFSLSPAEQLHRLVYGENCIPAAASFFYLLKLRELHLEEYDERIPMLEDWPKWIQLLSHGIRLHFVDKELVAYRVGGISVNFPPSVEYYKSGRLFFLYYQAPAYAADHYQELCDRIVYDELTIYEQFYHNYLGILHSNAYRLGRTLLTPIRWVKRLLAK